LPLFLIVEAMTELEYILKQVKFFHYKGWETGELRKCVDMLPKLSREELLALYRSRWVSEGDPIKENIFNILFKDKVGKREQRIRTEDTDALILEFKDKKGGNVSLARKELRDRYKAGKDKQKISAAFNSSTKSDQQWVKWQVRKELYGNSGNNGYQWKNRGGNK
jgi:hypothetical protein